MKKFLAIILAFALVLSFGTAAFAVTQISEEMRSRIEGLTNTDEMDAFIASIRFEEGMSDDTKQGIISDLWEVYNSTHPDATSPVEDDGGGKDLAYRGPALNQAKKPAANKEAKLFIDGEEVPFELIDITNADTLDAADKEAFLAAYELVKAIKDKVVKYFFWIMPAGVELAEGQTADFEFTCEGEGVAVKMNDKDMKVVAGAEADSYTAILTEFGALAILVDVA